MKKNHVKAISFIMAAVFSISALFAFPARDPDFNQPFTLNPITDGIIGGTGLALTGTAFIFDKIVPLKENDYKDFNFPLDKNDINGFDRPFIQNYSKTLDLVGDGLLALTLATPAIMFTNANTDWLTVGVMYAETIALANGIKEWGKLLIKRPRPYTYFEDYPNGEVERGDWHNSMPSGHTTMAFAGAAFISSIFYEYFPDSVWRHVVTAASFGLATSVGLVRMASGNHFATDVLAGAAIGTFCGFAVPFFHSQTFNNLVHKNDKVNVAASPLGFAVAIKF